MCARISFFNNFNFFESQETVNVLHLDLSDISLPVCIQIFLQNFEKKKTKKKRCCFQDDL